MDKKITEQNRKAWNEALLYHQKARNNSLQEGFKKADFTTLNRDCDKALLDKLKDIKLFGKVISQLPCNNGRELLSLMRFGAKEAVGFDISDIAIEEAKELTKISKLNAKFERVNILEIDSKFDNYFDFIYISEGSLQWFNDLNEYFSVVSRLLKKGGKVLIFEIHPFAYLFENDLFNPEKPDINLLTNYFDKGPYSYKDGLDYIGEVKYKADKCYWFMHKLSDILSAVSKAGIEIQDFNEYNFDMLSNEEQLRYTEKFPLSYILSGVKK